MKRTYISPETEYLEIVTCSMLAISIYGNKNSSSNDSNWADEYDTAEQRDAWDDIWSYM